MPERLLDGNPLNNYLERALTFNPDGILDGAESITIVGTYAYICCDEGLVVVDLSDPTCPKVTSISDTKNWIILIVWLCNSAMGL